MGQGGYKAGGIIESKKGETMMHTAKVDHSPAKTGGVKLGNAGGYKTGGVAKANAGGYKKGGAAKKAYATGGVVKSGAPVAMPQGRKTPSKPVSISQLSGTFKKGGSVTPAEAKLLKAHKSENASAMKSAKAYNNEVYSKYGKNVKMAAGGDPADMPMKGSSMSPKKQFKAIKEDVEFISGDRPESEYSRLFPFGSTTTSKRRQVAKDLMKDSDIVRFAAPGYGDAGQFYKHGGKTKKYSQGGSTSSAEDQAKTARNQKAYENWERIQREENEGMRNAILGAPKKMIEGIKGFFSKPPEGSVTKTEKSVTVTPAKKRGGSV
jgi:hypothetical protein